MFDHGLSVTIFCHFLLSVYVFDGLCIPRFLSEFLLFEGLTQNLAKIRIFYLEILFDIFYNKLPQYIYYKNWNL